MEIGTTLRLAGVAVTAIVLMLASGETSTAATPEDPPRVESSSIIFYGEPLGRSVEIHIDAGYCGGEEPPTFAGLGIRRGAALPNGRPTVVLEAFIRRTDPIVPPPPMPISPEGPIGPISVCAGLGGELAHRVRLPGPLGPVPALFDGSFAPPRRVRLDPQASIPSRGVRFGA